MSDFVFKAEKRNDSGKGASRRLRHAGKLPAVIYGGDKDPVAITLVHSEVLKHMRSDAVYSHILTVEVDGKSETVILRDLQRHPFKPFIQHMDFMRVNADEQIRINIPLHFINDETAKGVKQQGGMVSHLMTELEISCLPHALPEFIEVDLLHLELGGIIHVADIKSPAGVTILDDAEAAVVSITHQGSSGDDAAEGNGAEA